MKSCSNVEVGVHPGAAGIVWISYSRVAVAMVKSLCLDSMNCLETATSNPSLCAPVSYTRHPESPPGFPP